MAGLLLVATVAAAAPADLERCQRRIVAGARVLSRWGERALYGCVDRALGSVTADERGRAAAAGGCQRRLDKVRRVRRRLVAAGTQCAAETSATTLLGDDGLAFARLAAFCPTRPLQRGRTDDVFACQEAALTCTTDGAVARVVPRAAALVSFLGVPLDDGARCLTVSACGNGTIDGDETCDDGAANSDRRPDACRTTCRDAACGDRVVDGDEECDDGNHAAGDGCDPDCSVEEHDTCGNGTRETDAEECDDGNHRNGDGCTADCELERHVCGDGVVGDNEQCDDGGGNSDTAPDHCRRNCTEPRCGDGVVDGDTGEECEPPGSLLCTAGCSRRFSFAADPLRRPAASDGLAACQTALMRAGQRVFEQTSRLVGGCVGTAVHCVLRPDAPERQAEHCLIAAARRCRRAAERRDALVHRALARLARGCRSGTPPTAIALGPLLDPRGGLGFETVAATCPFDGARVPTAADLLRCALDGSRCDAETLVAQTVPRAYESLSGLDLDPDELFPCVVDPDTLDLPAGGTPPSDSLTGAFVSTVTRLSSHRRTE